ncbi:MAG TPA: phosphotransferase [Ktedonosporobacter sp.]|jgi:Ser/Thr protein kinase RdoA (MazF antagonist)|nr:phosphotransferase [Ktedonosporobacter sp.]
MQNESTFFATLVEEQYAVQNIQLRSLSPYNFDWRGIYHVELGDHVSWVLRAFRQDKGENWLVKPAAMLLFLKELKHPAPRVVRTHSGEVVGVVNGWWTFMTTFIEGTLADSSIRSLRALAGRTAELHMLDLDRAASTTPPIQASWKHPQQAVPECLQLLDQLRDQVPSELQPFYDEVSATLERMQQASLPVTLIHGDCCPGNAVQTPDGDIVLIDWDGAGYGPPVLDIGSLLLTCHFDQPQFPLITPDPSLIAAVVEGYCQQRLLSQAELEILVDAVRFNSAFHFARNLQSILQDNWRENLGLQKLRIRYDVAEEIAVIARRRCEQLL